METLQILLLGSPEVIWKGEPLKISRRMSRALLFYLALEGRASRRDLRSLFWPAEEDDGKLRANLRVALARLRAGLPDSDLLDVDADSIALDSERVSVDALRFLELVDLALRAAAQVSPETSLPERVAEQLRQAAALWRAPHFISGFSFTGDSPELDHWQSSTSQHLEGLYVRVLTHLADHYAASGDFDTALLWAQDGLQVDPWSESLHMRVLRWLHALGRGAAAAAHAQTLPDRFSREALEISEPLAALIRQARRGETPPLPEQLDWPVVRLARIPLVGRTDQLQALQLAFRRGGILQVLGEAGVGKTRLAYEFYRSLQPRPRLLLLNCLPGENNLPFQPLSDALRRSVHQEEWRHLNPAWLQQLAHLLPELTEEQPAALVDEELPVELLRGHIFEALRQLLLEVSRSGRLLVVLDGAQWCDEATLAALAYLNERRLFHDHGMLLVAARSEEPTPTLEAWIGPLRGAAGFKQLSLPALDSVETAELAQRVLNRAVPEPAVQRLAEDTGGNPLFLLETLFALLENTPAVGLDGALAKLPVGSGLHHLLRQRLSRLRPAARQVAAAAAVLRAGFTPDMLVEVTQLDLDAVVGALDELLDVQLIQPTSGQPEAGYGFVHGQIREVILWEQGLARQRLLHLRAARALTARMGDSRHFAAHLAYHYEQAGELLQAFRAWMQAGRHARGLFAIAEALEAFQAAERHVPVLKDLLSDEILYELYSVWGETIIYDFSDSPFKQQLYQRMLRLGEERHSPLLIGGALSQLAHQISFEDDPTRALETFQRAAYQLEALADPVPAAQNECRHGWYLMRLMRYADAALLLEKGLARVATAATPVPQELRANLEYRLGMLYLLTGWPVKALQVAENALSQAHSSGMVYGHLVMARARFYQAQYPAAQEHIRLGLQLAAAFDSPRMLGMFSVFQLEIELATGDIDAAWAHALAAIDLARTEKLPDILCIALTEQGDIYRLLGDSQAAMRAYQEGLAVGQGKWDSLTAQYRMGMALVDVGQQQEGLRQVEEAYMEARRLDLAEVYIPAMSLWAFLLTRAGRLDEALAVVQSLMEITRERQYRSSDMVGALVLSLDAIRRGDEREARRLIDSAILTAREVSNPFWELQCYRFITRLGALSKLEAARAQELLDRVARHARAPELLPLVESFLSRTHTALFD